MTSTYHPGAHRFSIFVVCWTVLLFVAGALVTSKDAALSVTDWPKSHGTWVPPLATLQGGDLFEFSHRVVAGGRSEEHTSELQSRLHLVCRLLLEKKKTSLYEMRLQASRHRLRDTLCQT